MNERQYNTRFLHAEPHSVERRSGVLDRMMVFSGNANRSLAEDIVRRLNMSLSRAVVGRFSDGEVMVEIIDSVRGQDVFVVQSTCRPVNENLMELLVMIDAVRRSSAARVTAVIPYFGYARQDRRPGRPACPSRPRWWPT